MLLNKLMEQYLQYIEYVEDRAHNTVLARKSAFDIFLDLSSAKRLEDITNDTFSYWVIRQRARSSARGYQLKGQTINKRIDHMRAFLNWCEDNDYTHHVKTRRLIKVTETEYTPKYYLREDIDRVLEHASMDEGIIIRILFDSLIRRSELASLRLSNLDGRKITYVGKGGKNSESFIDQRTRDLLDKWITEKKITNYIFPSWGGSGHITPNTVNNKVKHAFERVGIYGAHAHAMRHSGATELEMNGAPDKLISRLLNHSSTATTQIYTHAIEHDLIDLRDSYKVSYGIDKELTIC